jgi:hypothetical protein
MKRGILASLPREELLEDHLQEDEAEHHGQEELPDLLPEAALLVQRAVVVEGLHDRGAHRLGHALDLRLGKLGEVRLLAVHAHHEVDAVVVRGVEHVEARPLRLAELRHRARALARDHHLARLALGIGEDRLPVRIGGREERDERLAHVDVGGGRPRREVGDQLLHEGR